MQWAVWLAMVFAICQMIQAAEPIGPTEAMTRAAVTPQSVSVSVVVDDKGLLTLGEHHVLRCQNTPDGCCFVIEFLPWAAFEQKIPTGRFAGQRLLLKGDLSLVETLTFRMGVPVPVLRVKSPADIVIL